MCVVYLGIVYHTNEILAYHFFLRNHRLCNVHFNQNSLPNNILSTPLASSEFRQMFQGEKSSKSFLA